MFLSFSPAYIHALEVYYVPYPAGELSQLHNPLPTHDAQWNALEVSERQDFCSKGHVKDINNPIQLLIPLL